LFYSSKNNFVIAFSVGAIMNVTASLLMGIYITFDLLVSEGSACEFGYLNTASGMNLALIHLVN